MNRPLTIADFLDTMSPAALDDMERESMADSGLYQDIDPAAPNYWAAMGRYTKAGRQYVKRYSKES